MIRWRRISIRTAASVLAVLTITGCDAVTRPSDYREAHPLKVSQVAQELVLATRVEFAPLTSGERARFERFVVDYHARAAGPMTIQLDRRSAAQGDAKARVAALRKLLVRAGISTGEINVLPLGTTKTQAGAAVLSFQANQATLPECGKWDSNPTFNWSNRSQANFGCSTQRNLGLTVADPGDLNKAATMSGSDADRGERILNTYRTGATAGGDAAAGGAAAP